MFVILGSFVEWHIHRSIDSSNKLWCTPPSFCKALNCSWTWYYDSTGIVLGC